MQNVVLSGANQQRLAKWLEAGKFERADREAAKLLKQSPGDVTLLLLRAQANTSLGRPKAALTLTEKVLEREPTNTSAVLLRGQALSATSGHTAALSHFAKALERYETWQVRSTLIKYLMSLRRFSEALALLQSVPGKPDADAEVMNLVGVCLSNLEQKQDAIKAFEVGMQSDPTFLPNFKERARLAQFFERTDPRVYHLEILNIDPQDKFALVSFLWNCLDRCDWDKFRRLKPPDAAALFQGDELCSAWTYLAIDDNPAASLALQKAKRARDHAEVLTLPAPAQSQRVPDGKIRVGYFSGDFYDHATLHLLSGVIREHDRTRFELHCFDYGRNDATGAALKQQFDAVHAVSGLGDKAMADFARSIGLDAAIDLKGDTADARKKPFLFGMAPVQVNYLGYPGTIGSTAYHYIVADETVIPPEKEKYYAEKVIRLPTCYLPSDDRRRAALPPTRTAVGLPEGAVVLACLNNQYKICSEVFGVWMDVLQTVPEAVLWLLSGLGDAALQSAAEAAGVDPRRLVFAPRVATQAHLDRLAQADLYLDTFNVNSHTLASDVVCAAGVPMVTRLGQQFAARVGGSFCVAAGMPDLVTTTTARYRDVIIACAQNPKELTTLRGQIALNRRRLPMFSSEAYTRCFEAGLAKAVQRARSGKKPRSFSVPQEAVQ